MLKAVSDTILPDFSTLGNLITILLLLPVCSGLAFLLWQTLRRCTAEFRIYRSIWLLFKGQYDSAVQLIDELLRSGLLSKASTRACLYNKANCQHRQGRFKDSIATLTEIDRARVNSTLRAAISGLHGANLLLLDCELPDARQYLEDYHARTKFSSCLLSLAYCESLMGDFARADDLVKSFVDEADRRKRLMFSFSTVLVLDKAFARCHNNFFLGHCYMRKADMKQAAQHFTEAAVSPTANFYAERAKQLLATMT